MKPALPCALLATLLVLSACSSTSSRERLRSSSPRSAPAGQYVDPIAHAEAARRERYAEAATPPASALPSRPAPKPEPIDTRDPIVHAETHRRQVYERSATTRRQAEQALFEAQTYTGLSDAQLAEIRTAEVAMLRGDYAAAQTRLEQLKEQLSESFRPYRVQSGDTLWRISGRSSVYGNPELWPLIWHANRDSLPNPAHLLVDQILKIRPNPTVAEVVQAIDESRRWKPGKVQVGPVERVSD